MEINKDSYFLFSGGEVHCNKVPSAVPSPIVLKDYTMNGLMALMQYKQIWQRNKDHRMRHLDLIIPYLPYARQDRWINEDEPFSLKLYCNMINSLRFNSVTVYDCHSDVGPALLANCINVPQHEIAKRILPPEYFEPSQWPIVFISPDAGSYKKLSKLVPSSRIAVATKIRNEKGEITDTHIYAPFALEGLKCVIVDDICDGGRTFIDIAAQLQKLNVSAIELYVTHGIFSKGFPPLWDAGIKKIYTTNSFPKAESDGFIKVLKIC